MSSQDLGKFILRITVGALMLLHGIFKVQHGVGQLVGAVVAHGLPSFVAYGVYIGEVVGPILVIIGLFTRPAAAVIAIDMIVAVALVHLGQIGELNKGGGWELELQAFYLLGAVAIAFLGAGRLSVSRGAGRFD